MFSKSFTYAAEFNVDVCFFFNFWYNRLFNYSIKSNFTLSSMQRFSSWSQCQVKGKSAKSIHPAMDESIRMLQIHFTSWWIFVIPWKIPCNSFPRGLFPNYGHAEPPPSPPLRIGHLDIKDAQCPKNIDGRKISYHIISRQHFYVTHFKY